MGLAEGAWRPGEIECVLIWEGSRCEVGLGFTLMAVREPWKGAVGWVCSMMPGARGCWGDALSQQRMRDG